MIAASDVSVVVPTRGDVDLVPIIESWAGAGEVLVWDNSRRQDLAVYGRYAMIAEASRQVIVTQDDDVIIPPSSIAALLAAYEHGVLVANMPERFRHDFYADHCLVGFGAIFDRDLPQQAFDLLVSYVSRDECEVEPAVDSFKRTCDIVFTTLAPRKLLDLPYTDREFASAPNRMWKQPAHVSERTQMLDLVRKVAA